MDPWSNFPDAPQQQPSVDPWATFPSASGPAPQQARPVAPEDVRDPVTGVPGGIVRRTPEIAEDTSWADAIMRGADYVDNTAANALTGAREGIGNILGLPVDAMNAAPMLANLIPGVDGVGPMTDRPLLGSRYVNDLLSLYGFIPPPPAPQDAFQRGARRIGEEIGAASVPGVGLVGRFGGASLQAAREAPAIARLFGAEAAAANSGRFLANEAAVAIGAGMGATAANELSGNKNGESPWIDMGGAIGGAGFTGLGLAAIRSIRDIGRAFFGNGSYQDEVVREAVMRDLAASAGITAEPGQAPDITPLIEAAKGPRVADTIPGYRESLADRTRDPGIAALEYSRQSGPNAGAYTAQRAANTEAIDRAMAPIEPQATPGQFSSELELERGRRMTDAAVNTANAQDAYTNATRDLMPALTAEGRGADIRAALQDASGAAREVLADAWGPVNQSRQPVDMEALRSSFAGVDEGLSVAERQRFRPSEADIPGKLVNPETPAQPTGLLDAGGDPVMRPGQKASGEAPLSEITGIRSALTDAQREAATAGRSNEARVIGEYIDRVDSYMADKLPGDLRQQYDAARAATRDYHDRFSRPQTAIGQTLAEREGLPRVPDSAVPGKFVQSDQGRIADFEALMREAGNDTRVQSSVRDQILQDVSARGLMDSPQALTDYLGQYSTIFRQFPKLRAELGNAGALRSKLDEATRSQDELTQNLTKQGRSAVANYLTYGDERAATAMQGVLRSRDPASSIDELLTFVGDAPKAVEGARKVFWDTMQDASRARGRTTRTIDGAQPWSPQALADFLDNPVNGAVAERLYRDNPEHLERIREISQALKDVDARNAARAPNSSGTAQGMGSQLFTPEALQSRLYAYGSGRISGTFLVTSLVSVLVRRGVRKAQETGYQRMMDDVLTNADTARLMMEQNNPAARQALANKAKLWFGNEASSILNAMSADDEDENEAIMRGAD